MKKKYFSGRKIFVARINKGHSTAQLADMVGITCDHLNNIEMERVKPSVRIIVMLANALEVNVEAFFE